MKTHTLINFLLLALILCLAVAVFAGCGKQIEFKINFVVDGEVYATVNTAGGEAISMPENPTKDGETFDGWYWDKDIWKTPFTANSLLDTLLSSDMSVYAKWASDVSHGDGVITAPDFIVEDTNMRISVSNNTNNYSFIGKITVTQGVSWQISTDVYGMNVIPSKTVTLDIGDNIFYLLVTAGDSEQISLYTVTVRRKPLYTVTFVDGSGKAIETQTVEEGSCATQPTIVPERAGHVFAGWDYDLTTLIISAITISPNWEANTYTVTYDFNGGNPVENPSTYKITDNIVLAKPESTRTDYYFVGWYTADNIKVANLRGHSENLSLTAKWEPIFTHSGSTLTGVSAGARQNCSDLIIPATIDGIAITDISSYAFQGYTGLRSIVVPDNITSIGAGAFSGCSSLASITIPFVGGSRKTASDTYQYPFGYIFGTSSYTGGKATTPNYYGSSTSSTTNTTYYIPTTLKSVTVTGGNILYGAFYNCTGLTSITIPDNVTSIGSSAFWDCTGLTSITIPNSVTSIGVDAFSGCTGLISITIPDSVTSIGNSAFFGCTGLTSVTIGNGVTSMGEWAFSGCTGLTSVTIPDSVTSIGYRAFSVCTGLTSITIPDSVTSIGSSAFDYCNNLTYTTYDNAQYLGNNLNPYLVLVKATNTAITSCTVHANTKFICSSAFNYCTGLTSVTIPNSVTSIGYGAFSRCNSLVSITYQGTMAQWNAISKEYWKDSDMNIIINCTNGVLVEH